MGNKCLNRAGNSWTDACLIGLIVTVIIVIYVGILHIKLHNQFIRNSELHFRTDAVSERINLFRVENAPDGTYIIEHSDGSMEILHPDGRRAKLTETPIKSEEEIEK